jgi:cation diffusion facilitator family transporter
MAVEGVHAHADVHVHGPPPANGGDYEAAERLRERRAAQRRALRLALAANAAFLGVEVAGGFVFHSLALLADAAHMFSDVAALGIALVAQRLIDRPATTRHSYGLQRAEVLGAQVNGLVLVVVSGWILVEALRRLGADAEHVRGGGMLVVALAGLVVNVASAVVLARAGGHGHGHAHGPRRGADPEGERTHPHTVDDDTGGARAAGVHAALPPERAAGHGDVGGHDGHGHGHDHGEHRAPVSRSLNMRAAFLHMVADAAGSVGAILAGVAIVVWDATWADPLASLALAVLVLVSAWGLLRDTAHVLLEGTPSGVDPATVEEALVADPEVVTVHHLHVWNLASDVPSLTAHVVLQPDTSLHDAQTSGVRLKAMLERRFGIGHATLELECHACEPARPEVVRPGAPPADA